jgi:hypothetical protein
MYKELVMARRISERRKNSYEKKIRNQYFKIHEMEREIKELTEEIMEFPVSEEKEKNKKFLSKKLFAITTACNFERKALIYFRNEFEITYKEPAKLYLF